MSQVIFPSGQILPSRQRLRSSTVLGIANIAFADPHLLTYGQVTEKSLRYCNMKNVGLWQGTNFDELEINFEI